VVAAIAIQPSWHWKSPWPTLTPLQFRYPTGAGGAPAKSVSSPDCTTTLWFASDVHTCCPRPVRSRALSAVTVANADIRPLASSFTGIV
jgi:hypothetical protein